MKSINSIMSLPSNMFSNIEIPSDPVDNLLGHLFHIQKMYKEKQLSLKLKAYHSIIKTLTAGIHNIIKTPESSAETYRKTLEVYHKKLGKGTYLETRKTQLNEKKIVEQLIDYGEGKQVIKKINVSDPEFIEQTFVAFNSVMKHPILSQITKIPNFSFEAIQQLTQLIIIDDCEICQEKREIFEMYVYTKDSVYGIVENIKEMTIRVANPNLVDIQNGFHFMFNHYCKNCDQSRLSAYSIDPKVGEQLADLMKRMERARSG